ncbi:MAG: DUF4012 domain-containing protein [Candidatus Levybacteria bacterium]|nr:DUF4012 domain-containing protein [Candidatus Levybacteria bacterium]
MKKPVLLVEEKSASNIPLALIVDKRGNLGATILKNLADDLFIVYVSGIEPRASDLNTSNTFYVPFLKRFSQIPENLYSYIFIIDEGEPFIRESFNVFIQKARENKSPLVYITSLRNISWSFIDKIKGEYRKLKIIIYGDAFGGNWDDQNSIVNELIYQAKKHRKIKIPGDGMEKIFPVLEDDVVDEIIKLSFGTEDSFKIYYLFPRYPQTYLSLAHIFQKSNPDIKIDFVKKEKQNAETKILQEGKYLINDQYPLSKKLTGAEIDVKGSKQSEQKNNTNVMKKVKYIFKSLSLFLLIFLLLPFASTLLFSFLGYVEIRNSTNMLKSGSLEKAFNASSISKTFFEISKASANGFLFELAIFGQDRIADSLIANIDTGVKLSKGINYLSSAGFVLKNISSGNAKNFQNEILEPQFLARSAIVLFQEIYLENKLPDSYKSEINNYMSFIEQISVIQEALPDILAVDTKKTYLILFQNNMELRPGGGFIGSYGILSLDRGRIIDFVINDIYDADGQLKGHVEPPFPIRRYLQKPHWYMRDSNFDPDFRQSAYTAAFFLNEEMSQRVDGVIGIDVSFLKTLLNEIGPVEVPEYNEIVNSENMYLLTQTHAEKDFFPSSTQKKDFLRSLARAIQTKVSENKNLPYFSILRAVINSIEEKHIIFSFNNVNLQNLFTVNGWSSSLWDNRTSFSQQVNQNSISINDFFGINEANLGVNKANFFIERNITGEININEDGSVSSRATVVYKNNSVDWPGGDYKNYVRFILPQNASLSQVFMDGIPQKIGSAVTDPLIYEQKNFIPPQLLEIDRTEEAGKTIYGFLTMIPAQTTKKISIDYELPKNFNDDSSSILYSLKYFKQPGTETYPFILSITFPSSYQVVSFSDNLSVSDGKVLFSKEILKDQDFILSLGQEQ